MGRRAHRQRVPAVGHELRARGPGHARGRARALLADDPTSVVLDRRHADVARENARRAREVISDGGLGGAEHDVAAAAVAVAHRRPHVYFAWVRERAAVVWGLSSATTSRDDAWLFMDLGRSLERADMVARLLMTRSLAGTIGPNWTTLLRSCSAHEAYLRSVRAPASPSSAPPSSCWSTGCSRARSPSTSSAPRRILSELEPEGQRRSAADQARLALGRARTNLAVPTCARDPRRPAGPDAGRPARLRPGLQPGPRPLLPAGHHGLDQEARHVTHPSRSATQTRFQLLARDPDLVQRGAPPARRPAAPARPGFARRDLPGHVADELRRLLGDARHRLRGAASRTASSPSTATSGWRSCPSRSRPTGAPAWDDLRGPALTDLLAEYLANSPRRSLSRSWPTTRAQDGRARCRPTTRRAPSARTSTTPSGTCPAQRRSTRRRRTRGASAPASARTSRISPSARCAASASRPGTCPGTSTRAEGHRHRRDGARRVPRLDRMVGGRLARLRPDQRLRRSPTTTSSWRGPRVRRRHAHQGRLRGRTASCP